MSENIYDNWEEVKSSGNLFLVCNFRNANPDCPFADEVNALYEKLRHEELEQMKQFPMEYDLYHVKHLIEHEIFTLEQLVNEGVLPEGF